MLDFCLARALPLCTTSHVLCGSASQLFCDCVPHVLGVAASCPISAQAVASTSSPWRVLASRQRHTALPTGSEHEVQEEEAAEAEAQPDPTLIEKFHLTEGDEELRKTDCAERLWAHEHDIPDFSIDAAMDFLYDRLFAAHAPDSVVKVWCLLCSAPPLVSVHAFHGATLLVLLSTYMIFSWSPRRRTRARLCRPRVLQQRRGISAQHGWQGDWLSTCVLTSWPRVRRAERRSCMLKGRIAGAVDCACAHKTMLGVACMCLHTHDLPAVGWIQSGTELIVRARTRFETRNSK